MQGAEAVYTYKDANGRSLYQVIRFPKKEFRRLRKGSNGEMPGAGSLLDQMGAAAAAAATAGSGKFSWHSGLPNPAPFLCWNQ